jgi:hypothetical protein
MIPVNLVKIDGYNGFLGTFDNENWWKTKPLPGNIDIVTDAVWIYGQYHICSANMSDGTFSIYRSNDNGYTWVQVLNTTERINGIFKPDYGIALAATSDGWWRSINSGKTWTKVTSTAPNCFCCKELTKDVLIALSQNNIWRSTNGGQSWVSTKTSAENIVYSAVAGTYYDCLVGIGKTMWYSDDGGQTWLDITNFMAVGWPTSSEYVTITDIELTSITGSYTNYANQLYINLPTWVIQVELTNGYLMHYYSMRTPAYTATEHILPHMIKHEAKFLAKKSINNSLVSTESLHTGTSDIDRVVIFVGTNKYNLPMIKMSEDAGKTWSEIDTSSATIYNGPDMTQISSSNMFTDDIYFSAKWIHTDFCHNAFVTYDTWFERNQSLDTDLLIKLSIPCDKTYLFDICNKIRIDTHYGTDILNKTANIVQTIFDILNKKDITRNYITSGAFQVTYDIYIQPDVILAARLTCDYTPDIAILKTVLKEYFPRCYISDSEPKTYGMGLNIIDNHTEEVMNLIERYTPQAPDIRYPNIPYNVWDSRKEGVTL